MADKLTTKRILVLEAKFADGDTQNINVINPRDNITSAELSAGETLCARVLISEKSGAAFTGFNSAKLSQNNHIDYDLSA